MKIRGREILNKIILVHLYHESYVYPIRMKDFSTLNWWYNNFAIFTQLQPNA